MIYTIRIFPGWRMLGPDEIVQEDDRWVCHRDDVYNWRVYRTPEVGAVAGVGLRVNMSGNTPDYQCYRRDGPRVLPMNPYHAEPLPLP